MCETENAHSSQVIWIDSCFRVRITLIYSRLGALRMFLIIANETSTCVELALTRFNTKSFSLLKPPGKSEPPCINIAGGAVFVISVI